MGIYRELRYGSILLIAPLGKQTVIRTAGVLKLLTVRRPLDHCTTRSARIVSGRKLRTQYGRIAWIPFILLLNRKIRFPLPNHSHHLGLTWTDSQSNPMLRAWGIVSRCLNSGTTQLLKKRDQDRVASRWIEPWSATYHCYYYQCSAPTLSLIHV